MNQEVITETSILLNIKETQIKSVINLLEEGATIPFIARYRKEVTGNLNEEAIKQINDVYEYQVNLFNRKEDVIRLIDEKGMLTEELKQQILKSNKLVEVEDLYRPYKEKKKTKATEAIAKGLEPLAKEIMSFSDCYIQELAKQYLNEQVLTIKEALSGAKDIIAEWISDDAKYRKWIRKYIFNNGIIKTTKKKDSQDDKKTYEMYYEFQELIKTIKPHRVLAINRGEKQKVLTVKIDINNDDILEYLYSKIIKDNDTQVLEIVKEAINDSYKRLILPSITREIRSELTEFSEESAIKVFGNNLEKLLLLPPIKNKIVMGFDPAFRTGCKLAVIDEVGTLLDIAVIYPHEPHNKKESAKQVLVELINKHKIDIIAIGNGTASRESEEFVSDILKDYQSVKYVIINEAGASVYSASEIAIQEFPKLSVEERSAISIGRRLQDPLSELVKIDPKSIGIGLYQHDVNQKKLNEALDFVVEKAVNTVGVDINTASPSLLKYVSGLNKTTINNIVKYKEKNNLIKSREELKNIKGFGPKMYEQAIGFIRIIDGDNLLDQTPIHPESYSSALKLLKNLNIKLTDVLSIESNIFNDINLSSLSEELKIDIYTLEDIIKALQSPNRDPRDEYAAPILRSDVLEIKDLKEGMKLQGTVRNVVDFGVFIDIGLENDALAHISRLSNAYVKHPLDIVNVGDVVECYVYEINIEKKKVALSLISIS